MLCSLYGERTGADTLRQISELLARPTPTEGAVPRNGSLSERDALLITHADQVHEPRVAPLQTLAAFCEQRLADVVSGIHILPFYPWTSDDGFSVRDYFAVAPE